MNRRSLFAALAGVVSLGWLGRAKAGPVAHRTVEFDGNDFRWVAGRDIWFGPDSEYAENALHAEIRMEWEEAQVHAHT